MGLEVLGRTRLVKSEMKITMYNVLLCGEANYKVSANLCEVLESDSV